MDHLEFAEHILASVLEPLILVSFRPSVSLSYQILLGLMKAHGYRCYRAPKRTEYRHNDFDDTGQRPKLTRPPRVSEIGVYQMSPSLVDGRLAHDCGHVSPKIPVYQIVVTL